MGECTQCGQEIPFERLQVSIHGIYDMHLYTSFNGATVDEVIENYKQHNREKHPAIVGGEQIDDLGKASLCPVRVIIVSPNGKKEVLRQVGEMVHPDTSYSEKKEEKQLAEWRAAVLADPDISRILAANTTDQQTGG